MKKPLVTLPAIVLACCVYAQGVSAGLKGGINITNFSGGNFAGIDKEALVGFHAGAFLNFRLLGISVQPELLVSTAGAKLDGDNGDYKITYLAMPIMLKYRMLFGLYLEAGPQFSLKLGEKVGDKTINNFAKDLDLSAAIGAGIQTKRGLGVGVRYLAGLSKVGDFEATDVFSPDFKNSIFQVGLSFPLGK
ncbi:MAG: porin family protein [Bacteroidota bacterium]